MPPRELLVIRRIVQNFRRRKLGGHLLIAFLNLVEFFVQRQACHGVPLSK